MPLKYHGKTSILKLDTAAGAGVQDISTALDDGDETRDVDRPSVPTFGDQGERYGLLGLEDNKLSVSGFYRETASQKVHGKSAKLFMDQFSVFSYLSAGKVGRKIGYDSIPTLGDNAQRYPVAGLMSGDFSASGFTDFSANAIDQIMRAAKNVDPFAGGSTPIWSVAQNSTAIGAFVDLFLACPTKYNIKTGLKAITLDLGFAVDDVLDLGVSLRSEAAPETGPAPVNYASVDEAAASSLGAVAHLHVIAFTGTTATIKIQHSTDNSTWLDLMTFNAVTGVTKQRGAVAGGTTINRFVRAMVSAGTFTSMTFLVAFGRRGFTYGAAGTHRHFCGLMGGSLFGTLASTNPLGPTAFEFGPIGTAAGNPKRTGNCRLVDYSIDFGVDKPTRISLNLSVDGQITDAVYA